MGDATPTTDTHDPTLTTDIFGAPVVLGAVVVALLIGWQSLFALGAGVLTLSMPARAGHHLSTAATATLVGLLVASLARLGLNRAVD